MATPLTDSINALTRYANETTGASDTTLSDAVETLVAGYGGGEKAVLLRTVVPSTDSKEAIINFDNTWFNDYKFFVVKCHICYTAPDSEWLYYLWNTKSYSGLYYSSFSNTTVLFDTFFVLENTGSTVVFPKSNSAIRPQEAEYSILESGNYLCVKLYTHNYDEGAKFELYGIGKDTEQRVSVDDIATGFEDFGGDITINSTYIRGYAFARNWDTYDGTTMSKNATITSLYAPNCLSVGNTAFRLQSNLTKVILPECTKIEHSAFAGYSMYFVMFIKELYIPKIKTIGDNAFYWNAHGFEKLILPESLQTLGDYAFSQNRELKTVYFMGNNVTSIAKTCFITNPQTITDIYVPWSEGAVANAPWGASSAIIHYDTVYDSNGEPIT